MTGFEKFVRRDESLAMYTWFQLGGPAEYFAEPRNEDELIALVQRCNEESLPIRILGRGSNILVRDEGVPGVVVHLSSPYFHEIKVEDCSITAGGGTRLGRIVTTAVHMGLSGLETLVAIPGTLGGALHGNAGTRSGDIGQCTEQATVVTRSGEVLQQEREDIDFSYRRSSLDELVILEAKLQLERDDPTELAKQLQKHWIVRKATQPRGHQCAGCVFRNPQGENAGKLIDEAGLKGTRIGGAVVNERHANFIVAEHECTSQDVIRLIELVKNQVQQRLGIELERELEIW